MLPGGGDTTSLTPFTKVECVNNKVVAFLKDTVGPACAGPAEGSVISFEKIRFHSDEEDRRGSSPMARSRRRLVPIVHQGMTSVSAGGREGKTGEHGEDAKLNLLYLSPCLCPVETCPVGRLSTQPFLLCYVPATRNDARCSVCTQGKKWQGCLVRGLGGQLASRLLDVWWSALAVS